MRVGGAREHRPDKATVQYSVNGTEYFRGPKYDEPTASATRIIVGTVGSSKVIDDLISSGKLDVSEIEGKWESFVSQLVFSFLLFITLLASQTLVHEPHPERNIKK